MANRYQYQFNGTMKPKMSSIEGRVNIGTGGQVDATTASGTTYGLGAPSGWQGAYSGIIGLYKAGVNSVQRTTTGTYLVALEDGWTKGVQACNVQYISGVTGYAGASGLLLPNVNYVNAGQFAGGPSSSNPSTVCVSFIAASTGLLEDPPATAGFFILIRLNDSSSGPQ